MNAKIQRHDVEAVEGILGFPLKESDIGPTCMRVAITHLTPAKVRRLRELNFEIEAICPVSRDWILVFFRWWVKGVQIEMTVKPEIEKLNGEDVEAVEGIFNTCLYGKPQIDSNRIRCEISDLDAPNAREIVRSGFEIDEICPISHQGVQVFLRRWKNSRSNHDKCREPQDNGYS